MAVGLAVQHDRLLAGMQFLQLITRTFSNLNLVEHREIADTLSALAGSFLDCRARAIMLTAREDGGEGSLRMAASEGFGDVSALDSEAARGLWSSIMRDKMTRAVSSAELDQRWPDAPRVAREGLACAPIDLNDRSIGILVLAGKRSREPFFEADLTFLACATGIGSMAVANANANAAQRTQRVRAEQQAEQAEQEARAKQAALSELDRKLSIIEEQQHQISELSAPLLQVRPGVIALPLIGGLDEARSEDLAERLMAEIARRRARFVLLDITGVDAVNSMTADRIISMTRTARLLGATCVLTGVRPAVAMTLVSLGVDLSELDVEASFGAGLDACLARL